MGGYMTTRAVPRFGTRSVPKEPNRPATLMILVLDRCIADVLWIGKNVSCVLLPPWRAGRHACERHPRRPCNAGALAGRCSGGVVTLPQHRLVRAENGRNDAPWSRTPGKYQLRASSRKAAGP